MCIFIQDFKIIQSYFGFIYPIFYGLSIRVWSEIVYCNFLIFGNRPNGFKNHKFFFFMEIIIGIVVFRMVVQRTITQCDSSIFVLLIYHKSIVIEQHLFAYCHFLKLHLYNGALFDDVTNFNGLLCKNATTMNR